MITFSKFGIVFCYCVFLVDVLLFSPMELSFFFLLQKQIVPQEADVHIEKPTVNSAKALLKKMGVPDKEVCMLDET